MPPKRFKSEIIREILEVCRGEGTTKTRIVSQVKLNYRTVKPYLASLVERGLLEVQEGPTVLFRTTKRGLEVLEHLKAVDVQVSQDNDGNCYLASL